MTLPVPPPVPLAIRVATSPGEAHVAVVREDTLIDYALWRPGAPDGVGDIVIGRVSAVMPAMAGAFLALPDAEGFLPDSEGAKGLSVGSVLPVRIIRSAQGGKGPRLSARLPPDAQPRPGPNPVERMAVRYPGALVLTDDHAMAASLGRGVRVVPDVLDEPILEAIEALGRPVVEIPGGGRLSIWPTPALVAIDVDSAGTVDRGFGSAQHRHTAFNRALLPALAAQIRLRDLSGAIVVDLAGMPAKRRSLLGADIVTALAEDRLNPRFLGFTALGLAEIVRPRVHLPLHELLSSPLAAGLAGLRAVLAGGGGTNPRAMPALRAHPAVVAALRGDPVALADFTRRTGCEVTLRSDPSMADRTWRLDHG
ncbi:MAG TPA: ribonuclease E/G [Rhodopila sp.]|uniref:ribonuclease E/G n=1 Tax=Rhodopila sp. TaxID=2480087 RepID=UPI002CEA402A|nr:ribonuclease E/G [Rhodopila sp.]HVY18371.1 ribonuclease E/G [Rhodopila sp.]